MSYAHRPALRSSLLRSLFDDPKNRSGNESARDVRDTMEVDAEHELLPDDPSRASRGSLAGSRDTIDVVPERDLLPDDPPVKARSEEDEHIVTTHVDIAELGTRRHPLSSPPTTTDIDGSHPRRPGGGWLVAAGGALLLGAIVFGASTPPSVNKPATAAAAAAPPVTPLSPRTTNSPRDEQELAIRFALAREPGDLEAQRELALDPVYLTSREPGARRGPGKGTFDAAVALAAVRNAGLGSAQCGDGAAGATVVSVTFAPSGRVTRALVEDGPLQGTAVGGCIARHLRNVTIPPFDGDFQTVRTDLTLR